MNHPKDHKILPHIHNKVQRQVYYTQEVLFVRKGKMRVDFYNNDKKYITSVIVKSEDTILMASGDHGIEMIEVKQGPYSGDNDKTRFKPIDDKAIKYYE